MNFLCSGESISETNTQCCDGVEAKAMAEAEAEYKRLLYAEIYTVYGKQKVLIKRE